MNCTPREIAMRSATLLLFVLLLPAALYAQGEFVERGRTAFGVGGGFTFSQPGDYRQIAFGVTVEGTVDFSVTLGELTNQEGSSGSYTNLTLAGWIYKEGHNAPVSLALFAAGNYRGFDTGDRNIYAFGVNINKRLVSKNPQVFFQPSATIYHTYQSGSSYGKKNDFGGRAALTILWIPIDKFRGFVTGGYGVEGKTGMGEISLGIVTLFDSKK